MKKRKPVEKSCFLCGEVFFAADPRNLFCSRSCLTRSKTLKLESPYKNYTPKKRTPAEERFWARVDTSGDCWLWKAKLNSGGYGKFYAAPFTAAHRYSYFLHFGPIPEGMCICHKCDTRACVNPAHFFLGTKGDNNKDRAAKGRGAKKRTRGAQVKLTPALVQSIRSDMSNGLTRHEVIKLYGISYVTAVDIETKRTWAHI